MAAPISVSSAACSNTSARRPRSRNARASDRPPIPAPTIATRSPDPAIGTSSTRGRYGDIRRRRSTPAAESPASMLPPPREEDPGSDGRGVDLRQEAGRLHADHVRIGAHPSARGHSGHLASATSGHRSTPPETPPVPALGAEEATGSNAARRPPAFSHVTGPLRGL